MLPRRHKDAGDDQLAKLKYVWRKKRRLILPRVIKDVLRERLAYVSCYASVVCLALNLWASGVSWHAVVNRLAFYQLIEGFGGSAMPYVVGIGCTMLSSWFFVGRLTQSYCCTCTRSHNAMQERVGEDYHGCLTV